MGSYFVMRTIKLYLMEIILITAVPSLLAWPALPLLYCTVLTDTQGLEELLGVGER